jgi:hypothetical protein
VNLPLFRQFFPGRSAEDTVLRSPTTATPRNCCGASLLGMTYKMTTLEKRVLRTASVLVFALALWRADCFLLAAEDDAAVRDLRAHNAEVEWVTETGLIFKHTVSLPKDQQYYSVRIREHWSGGNAGLARIRDLPLLKELRLEHAPGIDDEGLARLGRLSELEDFTLVGVQVSSKGLGILRSMPRLKSLCIHQISVTDDTLADVAQARELKYVNFALLTGVSDKTVASLERLPRLKELILARTGVSDAGMERLNVNVQSLSLWQTQLSDACMKHFRRLKNLKHLNLSGTRITDKGLAVLGPLPELESISVVATGVTEAGVAAYVKTRPSNRAIEVVR